MGGCWLAKALEMEEAQDGLMAGQIPKVSENIRFVASRM
jgi:hypothetical protein